MLYLLSRARCLIRQDRFGLLGRLGRGCVLGIAGGLGLVGGRLGQSSAAAVPYTVAACSVTSTEAPVAAAVTSTVNASSRLFCNEDCVSSGSRQPEKGTSASSLTLKLCKLDANPLTRTSSA